MLTIEKYTLRELTADEVQSVGGGTTSQTIDITMQSSGACWDLYTQSSQICALGATVTSYTSIPCLSGSSTTTTTSTWCGS